MSGAGAGVLSLLSAGHAVGAQDIQAIAFDAFTIFDPRPITALARARFGERGDMLAGAWSTKLFGATRLATAARRYADFTTLADASLRFAAGSLDLTLSDEDRSAMIGAYGKLDLWPDVKPALERLKAANLRLVLLSNLSEAALRPNMRRAGIENDLEPPLSTDRVRRFKPTPEAYQMAIDVLRLPKHSIGLAAFAGWDAVGATWFGYRTARINRPAAPEERLDATPAIVALGIEGILEFAGLA